MNKTKNQSVAKIGGVMGGVTITQTGARIDGDVLEDTLERCMGEVGRASRACNFILGDLILATEAKYGTKYARWSEITGMDVDTLMSIVSVCKRVPMDRRRLNGNLTFSHHKAVAALPAAEQEKWLEGFLKLF